MKWKHLPPTCYGEWYDDAEWRAGCVWKRDCKREWRESPIGQAMRQKPRKATLHPPFSDVLAK